MGATDSVEQFRGAIQATGTIPGPPPVQMESPQGPGPLFFLAMLDIQSWALEFCEAAHVQAMGHSPPTGTFPGLPNVWEHHSGVVAPCSYILG